MSPPTLPRDTDLGGECVFADVTLTMDTGIYAAGEVHTSQASCSGVVGGVVRPVYFV
jgi:hypothetical protein